MNKPKNQWHSLLKRLLSDETGASAVEYGILVALIAAVIVAVVVVVGQKVSNGFNLLNTNWS